MKKENKNFVYNVIYQVFIYIFPLITIPYISRILGVDNIGIYSYTYSIVNCFMLFSMLGINNYGNREIAKCRDNKQLMSNKFFSIYVLQLCNALFMTFVYLVLIFFFFKDYKLLFLVQSINLISVFFDINWFYFGMEQFKITIKRNIIIKLLSTILIFIFVKDKNSLVLYAFIMGVANLFSQIYLFTILNRYITLKRVHIKFDEVINNLKKCLVLFIPVLAYSIYRIMDKTMIGLFSNVTEVGYYENAEKIINIPISIITALGTVMLPRMSYLLNNKDEKNKKIIGESFKLAMLLSCNMALGILLISNETSLIMFGNEFIKSGYIMSLLSITIIISAWASVFRTQYLIPKSLDKIYVVSTIGGALLNVIFNIIFIPVLGSIGACIGTIIAELFLCVSQSFCIKNEFNMKKFSGIMIKEFIKALFIFAIAIFVSNFFDSLFLKFIIKISIYFILFIIMNYKYILYDFLGYGGKNENKKR